MGRWRGGKMLNKNEGYRKKLSYSSATQAKNQPCLAVTSAVGNSSTVLLSCYCTSYSMGMSQALRQKVQCIHTYKITVWVTGRYQSLLALVPTPKCSRSILGCLQVQKATRLLSSGSNESDTKKAQQYLRKFQELVAWMIWRRVMWQTGLWKSWSALMKSDRWDFLGQLTQNATWGHVAVCMLTQKSKEGALLNHHDHILPLPHLFPRNCLSSSGWVPHLKSRYAQWSKCLWTKVQPPGTSCPISFTGIQVWSWLWVSVEWMFAHPDLGLDLGVFFTLCFAGFKTSIYLHLNSWKMDLADLGQKENHWTLPTQ